MKLKQTRIRNTKRILAEIDKDSNFIIGVIIDDEIKKSIKEKLYLDDLSGKIIFPSPELGKMCERNSVGENIPMKTLPKELEYKEREYNIKDWGGYYHSGISYDTYYRYPQRFIPPKEFKLISREVGKVEVLSIYDVFTNNSDNEEDIKYAANILLEIFGEVEAFNINDDKIEISNRTITEVNWEILPPGEKIWNAFLNKQFKNIPRTTEVLLRDRFEYINKFNPNKIFSGVGGYTDYLVYEFIDKGLYVFDSIKYGNAIYVFEGEWDSFSKLTKKEIILGNLHKSRIIHDKNWKKNLQQYLK